MNCIILLLIIVIIILVFFYLNDIRTQKDKPKLQNNKPRTESKPARSSKPASVYPDGRELLLMIKNNYLDPYYQFNISTLPVTTRMPNEKISGLDRKYLKYIKSEINSWNELLEAYRPNKKLIQIKEIKPIYVAETDVEFVMKVKVLLVYLDKNLYLQLTFYGKIIKSDDPMAYHDAYQLQLTELRPITRANYETQNKLKSPFMSMEDQMKYVEKVDKMHENEFM